MRAPGLPRVQVTPEGNTRVGRSGDDEARHTSQANQTDKGTRVKA